MLWLLHFQSSFLLMYLGKQQKGPTAWALQPHGDPEEALGFSLPRPSLSGHLGSKPAHVRCLTVPLEWMKNKSLFFQVADTKNLPNQSLWLEQTGKLQVISGRERSNFFSTIFFNGLVKRRTSPFFHLFIYLRERQRHSVCWFSPQMAVLSRVGPGQHQEKLGLQTGLPREWQQLHQTLELASAASQVPRLATRSRAEHLGTVCETSTGTGPVPRCSAADLAPC